MFIQFAFAIACVCRKFSQSKENRIGAGRQEFYPISESFQAFGWQQIYACGALYVFARRFIWWPRESRIWTISCNRCSFINMLQNVMLLQMSQQYDHYNCCQAKTWLIFAGSLHEIAVQQDVLGANKFSREENTNRQLPAKTIDNGTDFGLVASQKFLSGIWIHELHESCSHAIPPLNRSQYHIA